MAKKRFFPRAGTFGLVLTAWDIWRRIPPRQRRYLMRTARRHGPRLVMAAYAAGKARSPGLKPRRKP